VDVPQISRRGRLAPYQQIAGWLRDQIAAGRWPENEPLPAEKELADAFGVSRDAVRHALAVLRDDGLIETIPTRGSYVSGQGSQAAP
jgi:GntR family transcriptional regulator